MNKKTATPRISGVPRCPNTLWSDGETYALICFENFGSSFVPLDETITAKKLIFKYFHKFKDAYFSYTWLFINYNNKFC